jgi:signal peptidase I
MAKLKPIIVPKTPTTVKDVPVPTSEQPLLARHMPTAASIRETIESIAIAFILAFLFRTFEAEAFVIPTGSMAPTLMGRHKDLKCEKCDFPYQVSASEEVSREGNPKEYDDQIGSCTCPMCRYSMEIDGRNPQPSYSGDRIIVNKFSYQFNDPKRWDVIVFYFPEKASDNYIKRLAGLPNETLRIHFGDLWTHDNKVKQEGSESREEFIIARKPPDVLLTMLQPVFDNDYMPTIAKLGWPIRWQSDSTSTSTTDAWNSDDYANYQIDGKASGEVWLRYHHLVPSFNQWAAADSSGKTSPNQIKSQLITDFTAYDTGRSIAAMKGNFPPNSDLFGLHWVGDLAVSTTAELENNTGQVILELVKGGRKFQCRIDAATGKATLSISGEDTKSFQPTAQTKLRGPGKYNLRFSNCDQELMLWIDDSFVKFDQPTTYTDLHDNNPTPLDLSPVGVASEGAKMKLSHLKIMRDIYYIAMDQHSQMEFLNRYRANMLTDYKILPTLLGQGRAEQFFSDPAQWSDLNETNMRQVEFTLKADQFFPLGDNSAKSQDGRLWGSQYWVDRELLKGKALFIYWPHSWNKIPYVNIPFPFFPNFSRMHFIK